MIYWLPTYNFQYFSFFISKVGIYYERIVIFTKKQHANLDSESQER
jgi:hypothetical protein